MRSYRCTRPILAGIVAFAGFATHSRAQETAASKPVNEGEVFPRTIEESPKPSNDPMVENDPLDFALDPWNHAKSMMDDKYGLKFQGSYTFHYQRATHTLSDRQEEFGGRLDLGVNWTLLHTGEKDTGSLILLARSSENIGARQDYAVSDDAGSIMGTNSLHGGGEQIPISLNLLYWRQTFMDERLAVSVGKIHPNAWIDLSPIANDETRQFMSGAYTGNLANNGQGLWAPGIAVELNLDKNWYVNGVVANAMGRTATTGLDTLKDGHFYEALEVGYKVGEKGQPQGNYRLTGWHTDDTDGDGGYGISVGFDQEIAAGWAPFSRVGYGDPDSSAISTFVSFGIANLRPFDRRGDMFGIAGTYSRPSDGDLPEETIFETFYRLKITESIEFSPDLQWILHPAFQPDEDNLFVIGARLKILF